jgi:CubicO group peptidase (beta-lactamase class C family)
MAALDRPLAPAVGAQIDRYLERLVAQEYFSGAVLVAYQGDVILCRGYGLANRERGAPNTSTTRFRLASLTKPLTATAIMLLVERGAIQLHERIGHYLAHCPPLWDAITIHHLLTHTSGIPEYSTAPEFQSLLNRPWSPDALIDRFRSLPLDFQPGTYSGYSNSGYVLLGKLIEQVAGASYSAFLHEHLFLPLGMTSTGYDDTWHALSDSAEGYESATRTAEPVDMSAAYAAGGVYSTVEDLYRWDQAMYAGQLLPPAALDMIYTKFAPMSPATAYPGGYGYGWCITEDLSPKAGLLLPYVFHGGHVFGYHTQMRRYCRYGGNATVIVLSNLQTMPIGPLMRDVQDLLFASK